MEKRQITEEENGILSEYGILSDEIVNPGIQVYERGEILIDDGKPLTDLLLLTEGKVKTLIPAEGKAGLLLGMYVNRGIFDDTCLFRQDRVSHIRAVAESQVSVIALPYDINCRILMEQPQFIRYLASGFASFIDQAMNSFFFQKYPLEYQLCSYIAANRRDAEFVPVMKKLCRDLEAGEREIERCFQLLMNKGVLARGQKGYRIADPVRFEEYNKGIYMPKKQGGNHAG